MDYQMKRMKRKTVGIYITKEGSVEVRAPHSAPKAEIDRFVREKEAWILPHQAKALERKQMRDSYKIQPGGSVLFLGREYPSERSNIGRFPSTQPAFSCRRRPRRNCARPLRTSTAGRQKSIFQRRWNGLPRSLEKAPSKCASPRQKRAGAPARQRAGSIFPGGSCSRRRKESITLPCMSLRI